MAEKNDARFLLSRSSAWIENCELLRSRVFVGGIHATEYQEEEEEEIE